MSLDRWITIVILAGGALIQVALAVDAWVHRRADLEQKADGRLERLEADFAKIREKSSDEAGRWQIFIGQIEVRMAIVENICERRSRLRGK